MAHLIKSTFASMSRVVLIHETSQPQAERLGEALYAKINAMPWLFSVVFKILTVIFFLGAICWGGIFTALDVQAQKRYCRFWQESRLSLLRSYMGFCTQMLNFIQASYEEN